MPLSVPALRRALGSLIRKEVTDAAGADGKLSMAERQTLSPFVKSAAYGTAGKPVNDVVDKAMGKAMAGIAKQNQATGSGARLLSLAELAAITKADKKLGALTGRAAEIVLRGNAPVAADDVALKGAPAGVSLAKSGDLYTITVQDAAPRAPITLTISGHDVEIQMYPQSLNLGEALAPEGWSLEDARTFSVANGAFTQGVRIAKDPPGSLTTDEAAAKAKDGLIKYLKDERIHDADWEDYFPTTWAGVEADGTVQKIDDMLKLRDGESFGRLTDRYLWTGRGPYDLYTEVAVRKRDGKVLSAYIEID